MLLAAAFNALLKTLESRRPGGVSCWPTDSACASLRRSSPLPALSISPASALAALEGHLRYIAEQEQNRQITPEALQVVPPTGPGRLRSESCSTASALLPARSKSAILGSCSGRAGAGNCSTWAWLWLPLSP